MSKRKRDPKAPLKLAITANGKPNYPDFTSGSPVARTTDGLPGAQPNGYSIAPGAETPTTEPEVQDEGITQKIIVHAQPIGSSGTKNFAGYYSEEYLNDLRGKKAAELYDKMRRSDPRVKMCLSAVNNPIKSATWEIDPADDSDEQKQFADFIEHVLFNDMEKSWKGFLTEALTVVPFGFSVFEMIDKVVLNHPKFGSYNGIQELGFRSQRTIERWKLDPGSGKLKWITQYAYGDLQRLVDIPAEFCMVMTMDQEGSNYEGISLLRPCYGPWLRKQAYQKLMAIGIEKFAIPPVIAKIPANKFNSESKEYANLVEILTAYTSHESNYIIHPDDYSIDIPKNEFDAQKVQESINAENKEMVYAFLENFLELGMNSVGSFALAGGLREFFLTGIEHIAELIYGPINRILIPRMIKLNFGPQTAYPELKVSGIADRVGEEFGKLMKEFADSGYIRPDDPLEDHLRKRLHLPKRSLEGQREPKQAVGAQIPQTGQPDSMEGSNSLHERARRSLQLAEKVARKQIISGRDDMKEIMLKGLKKMGDDLVTQIMAKVKRASPAQRQTVIKQVDPRGLQDYRANLIAGLSAIAKDALAQARREVPKAKNVKLADFDDLPPDVKKKVQNQADLLGETQAADLKKVVAFRFVHSVEASDSDAMLEADLNDAVDTYVEGSTLDTAATNTASTVINQTRNAFFFEPEVLNEIEAFQFTNGDPVSEICQDLAGKIFPKDDPVSDQYLPPLHHNCKSYIVPILEPVKPDDLEQLRPSSSDLEKQITLSDRERGKYAA